MIYTMQRIIFVLIFSTILTVLATAPAWAATTLQLTKIGDSSTTNQTFRSWYYQGLNPLLQGMAGPDAQVSITLNSANNKVTADATGDWSFQPTTLIAGQHEVLISSEGEQIAFTLTIDDGSSSSATATASATPSATPTAVVLTDSGVGGVSTDSGELPVTGAVSQTMLLILGGLAVMGLGVAIRALSSAELVRED